LSKYYATASIRSWQNEALETLQSCHNPAKPILNAFAHVHDLSACGDIPLEDHASNIIHHRLLKQWVLRMGAQIYTFDQSS
jgi:hypothetical protein